MKAAILGAGNIAASMAQALGGLDDSLVESYAIAARDYDRAEAFARKWGIKKAYGSYEEMLEDPLVDLVYIATPHVFHYEHAKLCLEYGKPVLCEKPFTVKEWQAKELFALAKEKNLLIAEAMWTRYMPSRQMIQDVIDSGVVGEITSMAANLGYEHINIERMRRPELAGGALMDLGVYPLHFALMFFGDQIKEITSTCVKLETGVDAQESMTLIYEDGRMAVLYSSMLVHCNRLGEINGTKGCIEVQNINNCEEIRVLDEKRQVTARYPVPKQINGYEYEVLACKRALEQGLFECPELPHEEILKVVRLTEYLRKEWGVIYPFEQ